MHMKTGVEQSVYALVLLNMPPDKAVARGSDQPTAGDIGNLFSETVKEAGNSRHHHVCSRYQGWF